MQLFVKWILFIKNFLKKPKIFCSPIHGGAKKRYYSMDNKTSDKERNNFFFLLLANFCSGGKPIWIY